MTGEFLKIGLALAGVIGLILAGAKFAQSKTAASPGLLKTLGYLSMGPRKGIAIVKAGREVMLIAVTPTDLKLLKTVPEDAFDQAELKKIRENIDHLKGLKATLLKGRG
ncbi:MAG: hypothetical protein D6726_09525 [Nitrospirae bacterium]|nr:MAG: hypothetical protein D6726_09525 [Nitrospirota bacterium]